MVSLDAPETDWELSDQPAARQDSPSDLALQALASLEEKLQVVVRSIVISGWSYRQTARALELSPMTVRRRLSAGLEELRRQIAISRQTPGHLCPSGAPGS